MAAYSAADLEALLFSRATHVKWMVLGSGEAGLPPALLLSIEKRGQYSDDCKVLKRVLFNATEGVRRLANEFHVKLNALTDVFFTQLSATTVTGLQSIVFHLADQGAAELRLHGMHEHQLLWDQYSKYCKRKFPNVTVNTQQLEVPLVKGLLTVQAIRVPAPQTTTATPGTPTTPVTVAVHAVTCYYVRMCLQGQVRASLVLDCPSVDWIPCVTAAVHGAVADLVVVFHQSSSAVWSHPLMAVWRTLLPPTVQHIHVRNDGPVGGFVDALSTRQVMFHSVAPESFVLPAAVTADAGTAPRARNQPVEFCIFPTPGLLDTGGAVPPVAVADASDSDASSDSSGSCEIAAPTAKRRRLCAMCDDPWSDKWQLHATHQLAAVVRSVLVNPTCHPSCWCRPAAGTDSDHRLDEPSPVAVFLGTGAAAPSALRNCSSIFLSIPKGGPTCGLLLDAGEGCVQQLLRQFDSRAHEVVQDLCLVWISHHHSDHHSGLTLLLAWHHELVAACARAGKHVAPLTIIGPAGYVASFAVICKTLHMQATLLSFEDWDARSRVQPFGADHAAALRLVDLQQINVEHCFDARACIVRYSTGHMVVYSGDTRPCEALVRAGMGATLLIHEATFDDDEKDHAVRKRHSTANEALAIGLQMKAGNVILTHFSQRYSYFSQVNLNFLDGLPGVGIAFDGMRLPVAAPSDHLTHLMATLQHSLHSSHRNVSVEAEEEE